MFFQNNVVNQIRETLKYKIYYVNLQGGVIIEKKNLENLDKLGENFLVYNGICN